MLCRTAPLCLNSAVVNTQEQGDPLATKLTLSVALATAATTFSLAAFEAAAQGYVTSPPAGTVWKSGSGGCVRTGYWMPTLADADCDPDLVSRPAPAAPPPRAEVAASAAKARAAQARAAHTRRGRAVRVRSRHADPGRPREARKGTSGPRQAGLFRPPRHQHQRA